MTYELHAEDDTVDLTFEDADHHQQHWHSDDAGHHWTRK